MDRYILHDASWFLTNYFRAERERRYDEEKNRQAREESEEAVERDTEL